MISPEPYVREFCGYVPLATGAPAVRESVGGIAGLLLVYWSANNVPFTLWVVAELGFTVLLSTTLEAMF